MVGRGHVVTKDAIASISVDKIAEAVALGKIHSKQVINAQFLTDIGWIKAYELFKLIGSRTGKHLDKLDGALVCCDKCTPGAAKALIENGVQFVEARPPESKAKILSEVIPLKAGAADLGKIHLKFVISKGRLDYLISVENVHFENDLNPRKVQLRFLDEKRKFPSFDVGLEDIMNSSDGRLESGLSLKAHGDSIILYELYYGKSCLLMGEVGA